MKNEFSVESLLTEVKKSLSKYESLIKECESNPSKKKISEAESSKKKIEQKIKMVKTIIKTEDDTFKYISFIFFHSLLFFVQLIFVLIFFSLKFFQHHQPNFF